MMWSLLGKSFWKALHSFNKGTVRNSDLKQTKSYRSIPQHKFHFPTFGQREKCFCLQTKYRFLDLHHEDEWKVEDKRISLQILWGLLPYQRNVHKCSMVCLHFQILVPSFWYKAEIFHQKHVLLHFQLEQHDQKPFSRVLVLRLFFIYVEKRTSFFQEFAWKKWIRQG